MPSRPPVKAPCALREKAEQLLRENPGRRLDPPSQSMEELLRELSLLRIERELLEEKLLAARRLRAAEKMEALGLMAGGVAHDFSNVLGAMIGFAELAKDRAVKESRQEHHLRKVLEAGGRGRELIGQLLAFSRKKGVGLKPLRLSRVVSETIELLRASIPPAVAVKVDVDPEAGLVLADAGQMQQVLTHLCMNAVQAMGEEGGILHVALSGVSVPAEENADASRPDACVRLLVSDTGCGMPPDVVEKVFDPFFTTKISAAGLGLSAVWGIVRQHGGRIEVESAPGKGAVFKVCLPRAAQSPEADAVDRTVSGAANASSSSTTRRPSSIWTARHSLPRLRPVGRPGRLRRKPASRPLS